MTNPVTLPSLGKTPAGTPLARAIGEGVMFLMALRFLLTVGLFVAYLVWG